MPKPLSNGHILKIGALIIGAIVLWAGSFAASRAVTSMSEPEVRVLIDDKIIPVREAQQEMKQELREQSKKIDSLNEKQTKALTILDLIEKKL